MINIRLAVKEDLKDLTTNLVLMAWESERLAVETRAAEKRVKLVLRHPKTGLYFVAQNDVGTVLGSMLVVNEYNALKKRACWWINDLYVMPTERREGVASALLKKIAAIAKAEPIPTDIRLHVDRDNFIARDCYDRVGFRVANYVPMEIICNAQES